MKKVIDVVPKGKPFQFLMGGFSVIGRGKVLTFSKIVL